MNEDTAVNANFYLLINIKEEEKKIIPFRVFNRVSFLLVL